MTDWSQVAWRKSTWCDTNSCVEVALVGSRIAVRDSKDKNGPVLAFTGPEWHALLAGDMR